MMADLSLHFFIQFQWEWTQSLAEDWKSFCFQTKHHNPCQWSIGIHCICSHCMWRLNFDVQNQNSNWLQRRKSKHFFFVTVSKTIIVKCLLARHFGLKYFYMLLVYVLMWRSSVCAFVYRLVTNRTPYMPPPDLRQRVERIASEHIQEEHDDLLVATFGNNLTKFKVWIVFFSFM